MRICKCIEQNVTVRWLLIGVFFVMSGVSLAACSSQDGEGHVDVVTDDMEGMATTTTIDSPREYAGNDKAGASTAGFVDEKIGVEAIVDDFLAGMWPRGNSRDSYIYAHQSKLESDDPWTKSRGEFEASVIIELGRNSSVNDPYFVQLFGAANSSYMTCFVEALGKTVEDDFLELSNFTPEQYQELYDELGWDEQQLIAVENRCWVEALEFRSLGESEGERLLDLQRKYYLDIAREWVAANPDLVVPLPG